MKPERPIRINSGIKPADHQEVKRWAALLASFDAKLLLASFDAKLKIGL